MRRAISLSIIAAVLLTCVGGISLANTENSLTNFSKVQTYSEGTFIDISGWYVDFVKEAYEYGIVSGVGNNRFAPQNNLTTQEAITIGARIHAIYKYGYDAVDSKIDDYSLPDDQWYSKFVAYAKAEGIIGVEFDYLIGQNITRAQMVHCWSRILLPADMPKVNTVNSLPDVNDSTEYKDSIFMMYEAGILSGTDSIGTFNPDRAITRAECSTIFMKLIDKASRSSGKTFPDSETIMVGDVPFNSEEDIFQDPINGADKITIAKQNEFIDSLIANSKGLTINKDFSEVDIDFTLIPLPEGFEWEIRIEWGGDRWMGARLLTPDPYVTTAISPVNGKFVSRLWRETESIPTYITFIANIQGERGAAGSVFIQYNVDTDTHSTVYGSSKNSDSLVGYEHWFNKGFNFIQ
jgi:hypothetical protein